MHRISDLRFTGTAAGSSETLLAMRRGTAHRNVVVVTNMWWKVTPEIDIVRGRRLASGFFKPPLDKGARFLHYNDTTEPAHEIIQTVLEN